MYTSGHNALLLMKGGWNSRVDLLSPQPMLFTLLLMYLEWCKVKQQCAKGSCRMFFYCTYYYVGQRWYAKHSSSLNMGIFMGIFKYPALRYVNTSKKRRYSNTAISRQLRIQAGGLTSCELGHAAIVAVVHVIIYR